MPRACEAARDHNRRLDFEAFPLLCSVPSSIQLRIMSFSVRSVESAVLFRVVKSLFFAQERGMLHTFYRQNLFDLVWSEPIRMIAKRLGISDVGLAKACRRADLLLPPRGY